MTLPQKAIEQVGTSAAGWRRAFAETVRSATVEVYRGPLEADAALWSKCAAQLGAGPGFKVRAARHRPVVRSLAELHQKLEGVMVRLWDDAVVREGV